MKKPICLVLAILMALNCMVFSVSAASGEKSQTRRNIAIVFDNSGSMYEYNNLAWCRAIYSMEVFASMMNEGDTMTVYPMHQVEIDGKRFDSSNPVIIHGPSEAETVRKMYTPEAEGTPIETIDAAFNGMRGKDGECWLIVLTDGASFHENDRDLGGQTSAKLTERLSEYNKSINILYLGIGASAAMPSMNGGQYKYYADKASDSDQVLTKLTNMCNMIFGRDTMSVSSNEVNIDVSMKKMILFVQGRDVSNVSVTDVNGNEIGQKSDVHTMKYSELGAGGDNHGNAVDENLQGMIVTYSDCRAGSYRLSCSGDVSSAVAYYEPDVDLVVQLVDEGGNVISGDEVAYAGNYTLRYGLKDNQTGQLVESDLLGSTHYEIEYTINGETYTASSDRKQDSLTVSLEAGDVLDATISAEYLSGYRITKSGPDFGWPDGGFQIEVRSIDPNLFTLTLTGGQADYPLSEMEDLGHYHLSASYAGVPLTGELLERTEPRLEVVGGNIGVTASRSADGSGFDIQLLFNQDPLHTDTGEFILRYGVSYTNEDGASGLSPALEQPFTVTNDGYGLSMKMSAEQTYYEIAKIEEGEPILVQLAKDGEALSDEELEAVTLEIDTEGIPYEVEINRGMSGFKIFLKSGDKIETGKHKIYCKATTVDSVGQNIGAEDDLQIDVQKYPSWVRWAITGGILLLLLLLVLLILNQKVLPKKVLRAGDSDFNIGGKTIEDNAKIAYSKSSKSLDITAPSVPTYPYVSCSVKMKVAAVSPRRIPSGKRQMEVTEVKATNDITSVEVGASIYELDPATGRFVKEGNSPTIISNNSVIAVNGTAQTPNGRKKTAILSQQLRFK